MGTDVPRYGEKVDSVPDLPVVTYEEYQRASNGLSYEAIAAIFGRRGQEVTWVRIGDSSSAVYKWSNPDGSWVQCWFSDDKMTAKTNYDLR